MELLILLNQQASRNQAGMGFRSPMSALRIRQLQSYEAGNYLSIERHCCSFSTVENSILDQLPVGDPVLAENLFNNLTSPDILVPLCTFLAYISTPAAIIAGDPVIEDLAFKPITGDIGSIPAVEVRLQSMLNFSNRIQ